MARTRKVGVVSGAFEADTTSQELLSVARERSDATHVDPVDFNVVDSNLRVGSKSLEEFDALIIRLLSTDGDPSFQYDFLEQLSTRNVLLVNSPRALGIAESKFLSIMVLREYGLSVPPTAVSQSTEDVFRFLELYGDVVVKPLYGFQGQDVVRITKRDLPSENEVARIMSDYRSVMVQRFVPNPGRDIRAFVVGGRVIAAAYRMAPPGSWKTNVFTGGEVVPHRLTEDEEAMCAKAAAAAGLDYTGVDLIEGPEGPVILEVNGSPAWSGLERATGADIARAIVDLTLGKLD